MKYGFIAVAFVLIAVSIAIAISNWNECRSLHSFLYCATQLR